MKARLFDTVRLTVALPAEALPEGAIGTVVEEFSSPNEAYEVEFADGDGQTIAQVTLTPDQITVLRGHGE